MPAYNAYQPDTTYHPNPLISLVKKYGSSNLFLTGLVFLSIVAAIQFFMAIASHSTFMAGVYDGLSEFDRDTAAIMHQYIEYFEAGGIAIMIISILFAIPELVLVIGMWLACKWCRDYEDTSVKTIGFTIVKRVYIFNLIAGCLMCVGLLIGGIAMLASSSAVPAETAFLLVGLGIIAIIAFIVATPLVVLFNLSVVKAAGAIKESLSYSPPLKMPILMPIFVLVSAGFSGFGALGTLFTDPLSALSTGISVTASIILAVAYLKFRSEYATVRRSV